MYYPYLSATNKQTIIAAFKRMEIMHNSKKPEKLLIDVIGLSKLQCSFPIQGKLAYASNENFMGRIVEGYAKDANDICLLTQEAAHALCKVQNDLIPQGLSLFIFDAYRPLRAVRDFVKWFHEPHMNAYELERKAIHFPHLNKTELAPRGYIADVVSQHNFGHTVDLSLFSIADRKHLDMGACFDFFDELSHSTATAEQIGQLALTNRLTLKEVMQKHQFLPHRYEFWHFNFFKAVTDEPMDLPITKKYKNLNVK